MDINSVNLISDKVYKELFQFDNPDFIHLYVISGSDMEKDVFSLLGSVNVYAFKREDHENEKSYFVYKNDVDCSFLAMITIKYHCITTRRGIRSDDEGAAVPNTVYFIIC